MCLLPPHLYRYAHTHTHTHSLYFSLPPISVSNIIHSHGKKANCILQQKSRKECSLPSALALVAQVELGQNECGAGQPRIGRAPLFQSRAGNRDTGVRGGLLQHQQPHDKQRPREPSPSHPAKDSAGWRRCPQVLQTGGGDSRPWRLQKLGTE